MQRKVRAVFACYFRVLHGVALHGLEHLPASGEGAVLVVNHQSLADGCFVATFLPGSPMFAVSADVARRWWARPFLAVIRSFGIDPTNAFAVKSMVAAVREGNTLVMFPEGRITTTGSLMKIYDGAAVIADRANVKLIGIRIDGLQRTRFARTPGHAGLRWFPRLSMTVLPPIAIVVDAALRGRARRQAVGEFVRGLMQRAEFEAMDTSRSLYTALLDASRYHGGGTPMIEDEHRTPLSYRDFIRNVATLAQRLKRDIGPGEVVGVMLPNGVAMVTAFMALQALGAIPLLLDPARGGQDRLASCVAMGAAVVLVSRGLCDASANAMAKPRVIWLEDAARPSVPERLRRLVTFHGIETLAGARTSAQSPAVMMLGVGEAGVSGPVRLSHGDILAAIARATPLLGVNSAERFITTISVADPFGLTLGVLLPLLRGARLVVSPPAYRSWRALELIYDTDCTVIVTDWETLDGVVASAGPHAFYRTSRILIRGCASPTQRQSLHARGIPARLIGEVELNLFQPTEAGPTGRTSS